MDFALVHVGHSRIQQRILCLSLLLRAKPEILKDLQNRFSWDEDEMVGKNLERTLVRGHLSISAYVFLKSMQVVCCCFRQFEINLRQRKPRTTILGEA